MQYVEVIGWLGAIFTLGAYSMRSMLRLRITALAANLAFITYGAAAPVYPMLALHLALLPLNLFRLREILFGMSQLRKARTAEHPLEALKPFLKPTKFSDGDVIFRRGDPPDHVYFLEKGSIVLPELGETLSGRTIFGEMAYFTSANARTTSAICEGDCSIMKIDERSFMSLYHQHPEFGHFVIRLIAERLISGSRKNPEIYDGFSSAVEQTSLQ